MFKHHSLFLLFDKSSTECRQSRLFCAPFEGLWCFFRVFAAMPLLSASAGFFGDDVFLTLAPVWIFFDKDALQGKRIHLCVVHQTRVGGWSRGENLHLFGVDLQFV